MDIEDVKEWINIADNDFDSAQILNGAVRKHFEVICYLCAQATEKYLKGYLISNDIVPERTHNLPFLNSLCIETDSNFADIKIVCDFLNQFANNVRYPHKYEITENDVNFSIGAVEKVRNLKQILDLRNIIGPRIPPDV
jgi:HEPN domain-containing protein